MLLRMKQSKRIGILFEILYLLIATLARVLARNDEKIFGAATLVALLGM
ncbi:MAG: hypothetical protein K2N12_09915 [Helicobacter sp.]|nr:hypothetical protein [Helicobacter sp.]